MNNVRGLLLIRFAIIVFVLIGLLPPASASADAFRSLQIAFTSPFGTQSHNPNLTNPINAWIRIPDWLAGTWTSRSQILLYSYDFKKRKHIILEPVQLTVHRTSTIGAQKDGAGQVWHFTGRPYVRFVETPAYTERQDIHIVEIVDGNSNTLITKTIAMVYHIDTRTQSSIDQFVEETYTTYELLGDGLILVTYLVNDFDLFGDTRNSSRSVCMQRRIKPFERIDNDERGNLLKLFTEFVR